jgi:uncharacterized hydrophobic protein (TIGR00271 family)
MNYLKRNQSLLFAIARLQKWLSWNLGVSPARKEEIYLDIVQSVTLTDVSYWMQVLFSAGIATLGLALNSPAVIIGAMLISPLMGSILANGLALAAGDIILALRALLNLILSCTVAIVFAFLLVSLLPFKELTSEILARTRPNLLDLGIALFSGTVGAIVLCKKPQGIATSIPGVSIAVALMPPLCVVGYGIGIAVSLNSVTGFQVARGGGLLFFTNLVTITFMAMLVFLGLHIDIPSVKERIREWRQQDPESIQVQRLLELVPASQRLKKVGSLPGRLLMILLTILLVSLPLNQSLDQLRSEIVSKQQENRLSSAATAVWQKNFASLPTGEKLSYISQLSLKSQDKQLRLQLQVVTSKVYTDADRQRYIQLLAKRLGRSAASISLNLVQIPTTSSELLHRIPEELASPSPPPTIAELQTRFLQGIETALRPFSLPAPAQWVSYEVTTSPVNPLRIQLAYLSWRDIDGDGQVVLRQTIRNQLNDPTAEITFQRITPITERISFAVNQSSLTPDQTRLLNRVGQLLQQYPPLQVALTAPEAPSEIGDGIHGKARSLAIRTYLQTKWQISPERCIFRTGTDLNSGVSLETVIPTLQTLPSEISPTDSPSSTTTPEGAPETSLPQ